MMCCLKAPAKINLVLEVLGKREDGYHNISSIMQTVSLYDEITFNTSDRISLKCSEPALQTDNNLVLRAAYLLKSITGCDKGASLELIKNIPFAAGLGGGSSDAATTLKGLNKLWALGLTDIQLSEVAARLGSDVPFFITGGCCMVEGRGEGVNSLPDLIETWFVLIKPDLTVPAEKTRTLYSLLQKKHYSGGDHVSKVLETIKKGESLSNCHIYNTFDYIARQAFQGLDRYGEFIDGSSGMEFHLAGSGPLLFRVADSQSHAKTIHEWLVGKSIESCIVRSLKR